MVRGVLCWPAVVAVLLLAAVYVASAAFVPQEDFGTSCDGTAFAFVSDDHLSNALAIARAAVLKVRNGTAYPMTRLDATVLLPPKGAPLVDSAGRTLNGGQRLPVPDRANKQTWRRGVYNPMAVAYPASCVKLTYLLSAMHWCEAQGKRYDCLDEHVRPMISISSNFETGVIVDIITKALNYEPASLDQRFMEWIKKRNSTKEYLESLNLLGNMNPLSKTYPSNSGETKYGAESLAIDKYGMNLMNPVCSATIILEAISGVIQPEAVDYIRNLLRHERYTGYTSFGFGLPPATVIRSKIGDAYDTVEEIAHIWLPNGREFILTAFSNGYEPNQPNPYDVSVLGLFAETFLENVPELNAGLPPRIRLDATDKSFFTVGKWQRAIAPGTYGSFYAFANEGANVSAGWDAHFDEAGMYEVSVWHPESDGFAATATATINHLHGATEATIYQRSYGGRWVYLGDWNFPAGLNKAALVVSPAERLSSAAPIVVNAVKFSKWPSCQGVVGAPCPLVP